MFGFPGSVRRLALTLIVKLPRVRPGRSQGEAATAAIGNKARGSDALSAACFLLTHGLFPPSSVIASASHPCAPRLVTTIKISLTLYALLHPVRSLLV